MLRVLLLGLGLVLAAGEARAVEIDGTVRNAGGGTATVIIETDLVPNVGDKVDFFYRTAGTTEEVSVARGIVSAVSLDAVIEVKIEQATSEVAKDQLVRIHSDAPVKWAAAPPAAAPSAPAAPVAAPPAPPAVPPLAAAPPPAAPSAPDAVQLAPKVMTGGELRRFEDNPELIWDVAFSPDGTVLASGFNDGGIALWDVASGKISSSFKAHDKLITQVAFSPDGSLIASASDDNTAALWDAKSGKLKHKLKGHTDGVQSVAFSADGTTLATGSDDSTIRIWNVQTGEPLRTIKGQAYSVHNLVFSPAGSTRTLIASSGWADGVTLWDVASGEKVFSFSDHPHYVDEMAFSPDWSRAATATDNLLKIWDVKNGALLHTLEHGSADYADIDAMRFSPDGSLVVTAEERALKMWDAATGALILTVNDPMHALTSVAFAADGSPLAIGGGAIKLLDLERGVVVQR